MPKRIPLISIGVSREGKPVYPQVGKAFDFTADELADIRKQEKKLKIQIVRNPVNEDPDAGEGGEGVALADMTLPQLKAEAEKRGVELGDAKTKAQVLALLEAEDL